MTENEAINELQANIDLPFGFTVSDEASDMAIKALEEIQQYRAIGTVEEIQSMKDNGSFSGVELAQLAIMQMKLKDYKAIGTIEEFKQAINFKKYFMELYGEGLEVANWHKNGDLEPLTNFIDSALDWEGGE